MRTAKDQEYMVFYNPLNTCDTVVILMLMETLESKYTLRLFTVD